MSNPFKFGKIVDESIFVNRENDRFLLAQNFLNGINTILISPRRWGKSSLVNKVALEMQAQHPAIRFCQIDMFNVRNEQEFFNYLTKQLIQSTSTQWEEWLETAKKFISRLNPKISLGAEPNSNAEFSISLSDKKEDYIAILDLAEKIAIEKNIKLILCIDEFQNIEFFDNPLAFQKLLRAQWQKHQNVTYCLFGSKRHMMQQLFEKRSMPFYKFGDVFYLKKIETRPFKEFIVKAFAHSNKLISDELAEKLIHTVSNHSYYVQKLAHYLWNKTEKEATENLLNEAIDLMVQSQLPLLEKEFESLSNAQVQLMRMLASGVREGFSTAENIQKFRLGSSANVARMMKALESKEVIDLFGKKPEFIDPVFEIWLRDYIFKQYKL